VDGPLGYLPQWTGILQDNKQQQTFWFSSRASCKATLLSSATNCQYLSGAGSKTNRKVAQHQMELLQIPTKITYKIISNCRPKFILPSMFQ